MFGLFDLSLSQTNLVSRNAHPIHHCSMNSATTIRSQNAKWSQHGFETSIDSKILSTLFFTPELIHAEDDLIVCPMGHSQDQTACLAAGFCFTLTWLCLYTAPGSVPQDGTLIHGSFSCFVDMQAKRLPRCGSEGWATLRPQILGQAS